MCKKQKMILIGATVAVIIGGTVGIHSLFNGTSVTEKSNTQANYSATSTKTSSAPQMVANVDYTDLVTIVSDSANKTKDDMIKIKVVVKNNSNTTFNYVRVDVYFYDEDSNVIGSTYINSGDSFLSGATQTLNRTITMPEGSKYYVPVVTKVSR